MLINQAISYALTTRKKSSKPKPHVKKQHGKELWHGNTESDSQPEVDNQYQSPWNSDSDLDTKPQISKCNALEYNAYAYITYSQHPWQTKHNVWR